MRRFPTTLVIVVIVVVGAIVGWRLFFPIESTRYSAVDKVRQQRSAIRLVETQVHAGGPIARETLRLDNLDGRSTASYAAQDRRGFVARFSETIGGYDVTFAFDALVRDGIWELQTPRFFHGDTSTIYTIEIAQTAGARSGAHHFSFADPHWLATAAGQQYEIRLDPHGKTPSEQDLLQMKSTSNADPRYQKIVDDFAGFGPPHFRATVASARAKLLRAK